MFNLFLYSKSILFTFLSSYSHSFLYNLLYINQLIHFIIIFIPLLFSVHEPIEFQLNESSFNNSLFTLLHMIYFVEHEIKVMLQSRILFSNRAFHIRMRTRMSIFIVFFERWELTSHPIAEKMREYLNLLFSLPLSQNTFIPAVRFSRSRVTRLSVGGGILDWQQIQGVKRIALKCRKERGTMCLDSLFERTLVSYRSLNFN